MRSLFLKNLLLVGLSSYLLQQYIVNHKYYQPATVETVQDANISQISSSEVFWVK